MKRMTVLVLLASALLSSVAWAGGSGFENRRGTVSISNSGIVSKGSQLVVCDGWLARQSFGSVSFVAGVLTSGTLRGGGTFSATGSSFTVIGRCKEGEPKGELFSGSFVGPINWLLVSVRGEKLSFTLSGFIRGTNRKGRKVHAMTTQTIVTTKEQLAQGIGHIASGIVVFGT